MSTPITDATLAEPRTAALRATQAQYRPGFDTLTQTFLASLAHEDQTPATQAAATQIEASRLAMQQWMTLLAQAEDIYQPSHWSIYARTEFAHKVGPVLRQMEDVKHSLEAQTAKTVETAAALPGLPTDMIGTFNLLDRRRYLAEGERREPGSAYIAAIRAAVQGDDDTLLAAVVYAPPESGISLTADQRTAIREALIARRAPHLGTANMLATMLDRVIAAARRVAATAANPEGR